jgi:hypothetical protein
MIWVELDTELRLAFSRHRGVSVSNDYQLLPILTGVSPLRQPMSLPGLAPAEVPNCRISLDNADGRLTSLWRSDPPLRVVARVMTQAGELFSGIVTDIDLSPSATLVLEAGFVRPMSDRVPLRRTTEWGVYEDVRTLPVPYGRVTLEPIQYDSVGTWWVVADGAIAGVDAVTVDGAPLTGWTWRNGVDSTGRTVAYVGLPKLLTAGQVLAVTVRGRIHPLRGHMMEAPDEILWDLLSNVCGLGIAPAQLDAFRSEVVGLPLAGILDDHTITIRTQIDRIMQSLGAGWSIAADGIAALWPFADDGLTPAVADATPLTMQDLSSEAHHTDLVNVLRVKYAYDWSTGQHARTIEIQDADSIRRYGRIEADWDAGWLRLERQAQSLGRRLLDAMARPRWSVTWQSPAIHARPGDWVTIANPGSPIQARARLISADVDVASNTATLAVLGRQI